MKILHLISGGDSGGAKTHVFTLLDALKTKIDVKIICLTDGVFYNELEGRGVDYALVKQKNRFDLSVVKEINNIIQSEGFEILHVHGARANFIAMYLKKHTKIPVITTMHSDYLLDFTGGFYKKVVFTKLNSRALKKIDYFAAVSKDFKRMLINRGFSPNKIQVIYNGIVFNKVKITRSKEEYLKEKGVNYAPDDILIGILGRIDHVKGHDVFLNGASLVLKKHKNVKFLIAGTGELDAEYKEKVKELGIENNTIFLGFEDRPYDFLNAIDINSLTSYSESFPYAILEGAKMKKATVASDVGGIPDLIKTGKNGMLFKSRNAQSLCDAFCYLIENPKKIKEFGENLYEDVKNNFTDDNMAERHIEIYKQILKRQNDKREHDAVMVGYYGFDNSGDDALMKVIINELKNKNKFANIVVLSKKPNEVKREFLINSENRFNIFKVNRILKKTKLLMFGGGSLIQDVTSSRSLFYYLFIIMMAKRNNCKIMLYGSGVGPVLKKNDKKYVAKVLNRADVITLREPDSFDELKKLGVTNPEVIVTSDPAINLVAAEEIEVEKFTQRFGIKGNKKYFAVSVRKWDGFSEDDFEKLAYTADCISNKYGYTAMFLPMQTKVDTEVSEKIIKKMKTHAILIPDNLPSSVIMGIIKKTEFVIGMRLHTLIYAAAANIPSVGIVYDPKIVGFMKYMNQNTYVYVDDLTADNLLACAYRVIENKSEIIKEITERSKLLKEKASLNSEKALEFMKIH